MKRLTELTRRLPGWAQRGRAQIQALARGLESHVDGPLRGVVLSEAPLPARVAAYDALIGLALGADVEAGLALGEELLPAVEASPVALASLAHAYRLRHALVRPLELLTTAAARGGPAPGLASIAAMVTALEDGLELTPRRARNDLPHPVRVAYVVAASKPFHSAGYAARTHGLVCALAARDWDMNVIGRLGYPSDRLDYTTWQAPTRDAVVDGVPHHFTPNRQVLRFARDPLGYHREAAEALTRTLGELQPAIIHAASNYNVGLAAIEAGRQLGIPVVYEVRGLWHVSKASTDPGYAGSDHFAFVDRMEAQAASEADHAFAISSGVAAHLRDAGATAEFELLGNAADITAWTPGPGDLPLRQALRLGDGPVLGYVGSLNGYEGLDDVCAAMPRLPPHTVFVIVGDGPAREAIEAAATAHGVADRVRFVGRVPSDQAAAYYRLIDVVVLPRRPVSVCELVPPLKPFEAMAMARTVVASDVAAQADLIEHGHTGLLFAKGDLAALTTTLQRALADADLRTRLGTAARAWVIAHATWPAMAARVEAVYAHLLR